MCGNDEKTVITILHNVLLAPDLCNRLFSINTLMNLGHTCIFQKSFCTVYFGAKENNAVTLPHSAQMKHTFLEKIKEMSKKKKVPANEKIALELLHQILGHGSTSSLLDGGYCQCLGRCRAKNRSRPFLHIMSNFFNEKKG